MKNPCGSWVRVTLLLSAFVAATFLAPDYASADGGLLATATGGVGIDVDGDDASGEPGSWSIWTLSALYTPAGNLHEMNMGVVSGFGPTLRVDRLNGPRSTSLLFEATTGLDLYVIGLRQSIAFGRAFVGRGYPDGWELLFSTTVRAPFAALALFRFDIGPTWAGDVTTLRLGLSVGIDLFATD